MKIKLFIFSLIFIATCVWLGMYGEAYGYYEQAVSNSVYNVKISSNNLFSNCSNFQDICSVLETIGDFYYKSNDSILLCSYNELFSENYVYTIDTYDYSTFSIDFYFNIQNSSYNLSKYNFDTNGIDKYYNNNTNYTPCCRLRIVLYNNNKSLYEMYFVRYDNGNFVYVYPKARPTNTSGRTQFNDMYSESYTNITMHFNNSVLGTSTPSPITPPVNTFYYTPTLMIDDYNFKKSFRFDFEIPQIREDTKYYIFLEDYTRNNYSSVTADFQVISVTTPEDYDYSNYYNYLYYDDFEKKLYLPAGCDINIYEGSGNNNSTIELELMESATIPHFNLGGLTNLTYSGNIFLGEYDYYDLIPTDYHIESSFIGNTICTILNNLNFQVQGENAPVSLQFNIVNTFLQYLDVPMSIDDFRFAKFLIALYYGNNFAEDLTYDTNFHNFICGNSSIVSYENSKYDNTIDNTYYNFYRKTNVYNCENQINENFYRFQYTDAEDVSSMLPNGMSVDYLTSPFYSQNYNSSSGGYITYNINEIFYNYNTINYGAENSPLRYEPTQEFLSDTNDTDNQTLDNNTTSEIDNTSAENWFANIYRALLDIQDTLLSIKKNTENINYNVAYNLNQNFHYLFMPNPLEYQDILDDFDDIAEEHLGIVYQPIEFTSYVLGVVANIPDSNVIALSIPKVSFHDVDIIPETYFNFSTILENNQTFYTIHQIGLSAVDFLFIYLISMYAISVYKEVFGKDDN